MQIYWKRQTKKRNGKESWIFLSYVKDFDISVVSTRTFVRRNKRREIRFIFLIFLLDLIQEDYLLCGNSLNLLHILKSIRVYWLLEKRVGRSKCVKFYIPTDKEAVIRAGCVFDGAKRFRVTKTKLYSSLIWFDYEYLPPYFSSLNSFTITIKELAEWLDKMLTVDNVSNWNTYDTIKLYMKVLKRNERVDKNL